MGGGVKYRMMENSITFFDFFNETFPNLYELNKSVQVFSIFNKHFPWITLLSRLIGAHIDIAIIGDYLVTK